MYNQSIKPSAVFSKPYPIVTILCLAWSVVVFLAINSTKDSSWATFSKFGYYPITQIFEGRWYALITSAFVHREVIHIFFNMYWLMILGPVLERKFGSVKSLLFVLITAIISSGWQLATTHAGIGFSGVGFAIVGFGWIVRESDPELKRYFSDRILMTFAGWGVLCIVLDQLGVLPVANVAHISGAAAGALIGLIETKKMWLARIGVVVMAVVAFVPVYWNPLSTDWLFAKAYKAHGRKDYDTAIRFYRRCDELGLRDMAVWHNIAIIEGQRKHLPEYKEAIMRLRKLAPNDATVVVQEFGEPK